MNIDDITAKVRKISMETVAEVQKLNDVRNLNAQINAQKKMVQAMYGEIGKKLYDQYKEAPLDGFESDFQALNGAFEHIEQLREEIRAAKGVTLCPNCKMEVGVDERFCSNCGSKMPEVFRIVDEEAEKKPESTAASEMPEDTQEDQPTEMAENSTGEQMSDTTEDAAEDHAPDMLDETTEDHAPDMLDETTEDHAQEMPEDKPEDQALEMSEDKPEEQASEMPEDKQEEQASEMPEDMREERTSDAEENSEVTA
ncbi:MAG: hypothetical protein LUI14_14860 [Lachnospiraceae bacterium]|nr:hypothetical protein [Lachnospiraceae bacterium]